MSGPYPCSQSTFVISDKHSTLNNDVGKEKRPSAACFESLSYMTSLPPILLVGKKAMNSGAPKATPPPRYSRGI